MTLAYDDLRALAPRSVGEKQRIEALLKTLAVRERYSTRVIDSSYTPRFLAALQDAYERERETQMSGEAWL